MRPRPPTAGREILAIASCPDIGLAAVRILHLHVNIVLLGILNRLFAGVELQSNLTLRIRRRGPAHQRIDLTCLGGRELENPSMGFCRTGGHGGSGWLVDSGAHRTLSVS